MSGSMKSDRHVIQSELEFGSPKRFKERAGKVIAVNRNAAVPVLGRRV